MHHTKTSKNYHMNTLPSHLHIFLLLFSLALLASCNAQDSISSQKDKPAEANISQANHPKIVKTQGTGPADNVNCSLQDKSGNLWFGTTGEGVYYFDGDTFAHYTTQDGLNSNHVTGVIEDKAGNILFATNKGACRYNPAEDGTSGKSFIDMTQNTVLSDADISCLFEDEKGRLWISALHDGTYLYDRSAEQTGREIVTNFAANDSVKNDDSLRLRFITCMLADRTGNIWFGAWRDEGLARYDGKNLNQFRYDGTSPSDTKRARFYDYMFRSMLADKNGKLWFGTQLNGLFSYDPSEDGTGEKSLPARQESFVDVTQDTRLSNACIYAILADKNGNIWLCTERKGVWRYDGESFKNFTTEDGLTDNSVFSVVEDAAGNLWFGTRNMGLCRYDGKSFAHFSE